MSETVSLSIGFRGTVTALSNSSLYQRAQFNVQNAQGRVIASSTFSGNGERTSMKREENGLESFSFGPFNETMSIVVTISHSNSLKGQYLPNQTVDPVTVTKKPDPENPDTYIISTILSEDSGDKDYNDCIVSIFQFK